jgi:hypothetical protein
LKWRANSETCCTQVAWVCSGTRLPFADDRRVNEWLIHPRVPLPNGRRPPGAFEAARNQSDTAVLERPAIHLLLRIFHLVLFSRSPGALMYNLSILILACVDYLYVLARENVDADANKERATLLESSYLGAKDPTLAKPPNGSIKIPGSTCP